MSTEVIGPHRAELIDLGTTLQCRKCGKTVITFHDRTVRRPKPTKGRGR